MSRRPLNGLLRVSTCLISAVALSVGLGFGAPAIAAEAPRAETARTPAAQRPMNVLLIIADDLGTRIGPYGDTLVKTPNIDRLAREGLTFQRAYTQFPQCGQSRASFLTGRRPNSTKVLDLESDFREALPNAVTMPQYFKEHGYFSGRAGKVFHQGVPRDIGRDGLDDKASWIEAINPRGRDKDAEVEGRLNNLTPGVPLGNAFAVLADDGPDEAQTDGMVATQAIRMLEEHKDGSFFIAAGFYRPHVPEVAPKAYFDMYPLEQMPLAADTPADLAALPTVSIRLLPANVGASLEVQRQMVQSYFASTSFMDAQVGRVLDALKRLGLEDNTIVVFMSDHGYLLGEHGQWSKNVLWDGATHTPLIIRAPGVKTAGQSSPRPVELLDIYPTLVDLARLPPAKDLEGVSLVPLIKNPKAKWDRPAFSQIKGGRSVRTERWRYTEWEGGRLGASLYDLQADPLERQNLVKDPKFAKVATTMRNLLPKETVESRGAGLMIYDTEAKRLRTMSYADAIANPSLLPSAKP